MNPGEHDRLYNLLPALYRKVDEQQDGPLRALLAVLQEEIDRLEEDMRAQYDNWFIETCDRWAIPYIADLVGVRGLVDPQQLFDGQRRRVANALRYRRRKGTLAVLEHALRDVSDWPAHGAEYYKYLAVTQHVDHLRLDAGRTFDVRDWQALVAAGTPFDRSAHTADVRAIQATGRYQRRGRYNLMNVGLFLWRLRTYPVVNSPARPVGDGQGSPLQFTFDPLGRDIALFNTPAAAPEGFLETSLESLPLPLTRKLLAADLVAYAERQGSERSGNSTFYGPDRGLVISYGQDQAADGSLKRHIVPPEALLSLPLWEGLDGLEIPAGKSAAIDVERGRFAFLGDEWPKANGIPVVNYTYAFSDDIGGGPYERIVPSHLSEAGILHVYVAEGCVNEPIEVVAGQWQNPGPWFTQARTLAHALAVWEKFYVFCVETAQGQAPRPTSVIHIVDNGIYGSLDLEAGNDLTVRLGRGSRLSIVAADGFRPIIRTLHTLVISCESRSAVESTAPERQLHLNGLLVHSKIVIPEASFSGSLSIDIDHCTVMPGGIAVEAAQPAPQYTQLSIGRSLVGPVALASALGQFAVSDSIVDGQGRAAMSIDGDRTAGQTILKRVTVLGAMGLQSLTYAQDCLFVGPVTLATVHEGDAVRYSYFQALSIKERKEKLLLEHCEPEEPDLKPVSIPAFTSTTYGDPAYGQLSLDTPAKILRGAANGSSPGAFSRLNEPQRYDGIRPILDEYLPLGLEADLFFVT